MQTLEAFSEASFHGTCDQLQASINARTIGPVFVTNCEDLWPIYLENIDPAVRQTYNCHCCRSFIRRFGNLAVLDHDLDVTSALWRSRPVDPALRDAFAAMARAVERSKVVGVFYCKDTVWGTPEAGGWEHLHLTPPKALVFQHPTQTAGQAMAEKRQDFLTVMRALDEFSATVVDRAVAMLESDSLYRSEKVLGPAKWLQGIRRDMEKHLGRRSAVVWRAVATAPAGFCHPRSSMIGSLLEDLAAGKSNADVLSSFAAKMNPLRYQRPQAAPKAGAIAQAEKAVAEMGLERALARRECRLDEVANHLWQPTGRQPAQAGGVFAHLQTAHKAPAMLPMVTMTLDKFRRTMLDKADRIEIYAVPVGPYCTFTTAVDPDAPPIVQWDMEEARNPVAWYFHAGGSSSSSDYGLPTGQFCEVLDVCLQPSMWGPGFDHQGHGVMFVIKDARDRTGAEMCLFPEILRSELRGVRSVIEAHSNSKRLGRAEGQLAAGLMFKSGVTWNCELRVHMGEVCQPVRLDRWD